MEYTHPLDRLLYRMRKYVLLAAIIAAPISCYSYAWMVSDLAMALPWWMGIILVLSHLVTLLSIAALFDRRQERQSMRLYEPDEQPPRS